MSDATTELSSVSLIRGIQANPADERLWQIFTTRYGRYLRAIARQRLTDPDEVDDLIQDVYQRFLARVGDLRLDRPGGTRAYLRGMMRNATIDALRRRKPWAQAQGGSANLERLDDLPDAESELEQVIEEEVRALALAQVREELGPEDPNWRVFEMRVLRGLGYDQIVRELGISRGAAYQRYHQAEQQVAARYRELGEEVRS
jgi:RNA polymerase sigma factor (sigma-70 family)